jgi:hypothetical protein
MGCSHKQGCELFTQFALNPALKLWQVHYCDGNHTGCARYKLSLQGKRPPLNLLPNGRSIETPRSSMAYGAAALFNAILKNRINMVASLLRTGVDIHVRNPDGTTPLMAAAAKGHLEIMKLLLARGADIHARNGTGQSAADLAEAGSHAGAILLLQAFEARAQQATAARRR